MALAALLVGFAGAKVSVFFESTKFFAYFFQKKAIKQHLHRRKEEGTKALLSLSLPLSTLKSLPPNTLYSPLKIAKNCSEMTANC